MKDLPIEKFIKVEKGHAIVGQDKYLLEERYEDLSPFSGEYSYFGELDKGTQYAHFLDKRNPNNSISRLKMQVKMPNLLYENEFVLVGKKVDKFGNISNLNTIISPFGTYEMSEQEVVEVISPRVAIIEKEISKGKAAFYLKDLKDGSIIEEVIPNEYIPGSRINVIKDKEKNVYISVGHPDHPLYKGYKYTLEELHKIIFNKGKGYIR